MKPTKHFMERIATAELIAQEKKRMNLRNLSSKQLDILEDFYIAVQGQSDKVQNARWAEFVRSFPDIAKALEVGQPVAA